MLIIYIYLKYSIRALIYIYINEMLLKETLYVLKLFFYIEWNTPEE